MGFFDDLGKRMSNAGLVTRQMTREISEITRINALIELDEEKINSLYYQIGKRYVRLHKESSEDELKDLVLAVTDLEAEIEAFTDQIREIRGVQRCEKCGAEIPRENAFCGSCGAPVVKKEKKIVPDGYMICPNCEAKVKNGMKFCTSCGKLLSPGEEAEEPLASAETAASDAVPPMPAEKMGADPAPATEAEPAAESEVKAE